MTDIDLNDSGKRKLFEAAVKEALRIVREAKRIVPVDTGRLRSSITAVDSEGLLAASGPGAPDSPSTNFTVRVGTNVRYARFVEFGTEDMEAQPYLRPAIREVLGEFPSFGGSR